MLIFFLGLLLCYCITPGPPGSVLVAVTVPQRPRCEPLTTNGASVCMCICICPCVCTRYLVCVSGVCVVIGTQNNGEERWIAFFQKQPLSLAATKSVPTSSAAAAIQQHSSSSSSSSSSNNNGSRVLRLLPSCQNVTRGVCVCGWCTTGFEPRHYFDVQWDDQTHTDEPHTRDTNHIAAETKKQYIIRVIGTPVFRLFDLRCPQGYQRWGWGGGGAPSPKENLVLYTTFDEEHI